MNQTSTKDSEQVIKQTETNDSILWGSDGHCKWEAADGLSAGRGVCVVSLGAKRGSMIKGYQ